MAINLADNNPRIVYSVAQGVTQSVFSVPFEFFEDSDVNVYVDGVQKTEGSDYTLTGGEGSTGTLTFSSGVTGASGGSTVVLFRRIAIERTTDFQVGQDINRTALNEQLDTLTALVADMNDRWDRAVHLEDFDTGQVNFVLPPKAQRVNAYFAFDADGDPVMTSGTTSDIIVSTFAETLLDDDTAVDMLATLGITESAANVNNAANIFAGATVTSAGLALLDDADAAAQRTTLGLGNIATTDLIDEDDMASDSNTRAPTQQSVKAYVNGRGNFIASVDASNTASIDFTQFDATQYDAYEFVLMNVIPQSDGVVLRIRTSGDGGATYDGSNDYDYAGTYSATDEDEIIIGNLVGSAASERGWSGTVRVIGAHLSDRTAVVADGGFYNSTAGLVKVNVIGYRNASEVSNAIRFYFSFGAVDSGTITMYGLRNA